MKSFVLSYKKRENIDNPEDINVCEAHVNVWKVHVGTLRTHIQFFYDFGLKIKQDVGEVCLFVPFEIKENGKDFDLVRQLKNSNQLLCTVFNMDLKSDSSPTDSFSKVTSVEKNKEEFCLYQLGANKFKVETVKIGEKGKQKIIGSLLTIKLQEKPTNHVCKETTPLYIRFRIEAKNVKDAVISEHISNDFLQDAFSEIDMIDFRLNEQRDVHTEAIDKIKGAGFDFFSFDKVHLFFMAETKEVVQNGSSIKSDSRLLEKELWGSYIPKDAKDSHYIAHHWKKRIPTLDDNGKPKKDEYDTFKGYRIFFTSQYPKTNWIRLFVYLSVVVLLSWLGSMLSFSVMEVFTVSLPQYFKAIIIGVMLLIAIVFFVVTNYRLIVRLIRK